MNVHFSQASDEWATPQTLFDELDSEFQFTLDPCATPENAKCARFFTRAEDGLSRSWAGERVFCNPPYGREIAGWVKKLAEQRTAISVGLLPARTDTAWFHDYISGKAEVRFLRGRLKFGGSKKDAPFPSMVVIWRGDHAYCLSRGFTECEHTTSTNDV